MTVTLKVSVKAHPLQVILRTLLRAIVKALVRDRVPLKVFGSNRTNTNFDHKLQPLAEPGCQRYSETKRFANKPVFRVPRVSLQLVLIEA